MNIDEFDYELPESFIAQQPVEPRDASRLMVLDRYSGAIYHRRFRDLVEYLDPGDALVMNNTRVIPARLQAYRTDTGGKLEVLLLRQLDGLRWRVLVGNKRADLGTRIGFTGSDLQASVIGVCEGAERILEFSAPIDNDLTHFGKVPLPPYIMNPDIARERYQTVYSKVLGSVAAPTAGLHFTPELLLALRGKGVLISSCTLHIGLDTFQPVKVQDIRDHHIHSEYAVLEANDAHMINEAKLSGRRVIAVGTTSARTLETAAILSVGGDPSDPKSVNDVHSWHPLVSFAGDTSLYIYPGYRWRAVDVLLTNFHLPKSTLLMMVSSFAGRDFVMRAYEVAKREGYRFFSFGDAMLLL